MVNGSVSKWGRVSLNFGKLHTNFPRLNKCNQKPLKSFCVCIYMRVWVCVCACASINLFICWLFVYVLWVFIGNLLPILVICAFMCMRFLYYTSYPTPVVVVYRQFLWSFNNLITFHESIHHSIISIGLWRISPMDRQLQPEIELRKCTDDKCSDKETETQNLVMHVSYNSHLFITEIM